MVDAGDVRLRAAVRHEHGRVVSVEPAGDLTADEERTVLAPGFVNAHAHLDLGAASEVPAPKGGFLDWVSSVIKRRGELGVDEVATGVRRSAERLLSTGTTTVLDIDASGPAGGYRPDSAIRTVALREVIDGSPAEADDRTEQALGVAREALEVTETERRAVGLSPHGVHTVSDAVLAELALLRRGAPIVIHWAETPEETEWMLLGTGPFSGWLGRSPGLSGAERLARAGLLGGALMVHGNCPAPGELELLSQQGAAVVHCPGSHLYFGRSPFNLAAYRSAGVPVALGTDSWASNEDLDMRREMRLARETLGISGAEAWRMATEVGAQFAPWVHVTGRLGIGDAADLQRLRPQGWGDGALGEADTLLDRLTSAEPAVEAVWIGGDPVEH